MVIPCYRESPDFLQRVSSPPDGRSLLLICVLNRPAHDPDSLANQELRELLAGQRRTELAGHYALHAATNAPGVNLLSLDLEGLEGPTPSDQGVGRARRLGFDLALWLIQSGHVGSDWILSCDADSQWSEQHLREDWPTSAGATCLPFCHRVDPETPVGRATLLYELRLHHYVLGLTFANSPYAYHTLGSSIAVRNSAYAAVRGMPLRSGGEDFYLLSKLAKIAPVHRASGATVRIDARPSDRVPFGTGPAVRRLLQATDPLAAPLFYHPRCFSLLRGVLSGFTDWATAGAGDWRDHLRGTLDPAYFTTVSGILEGMDVDKALAHAQRHGNDRRSRLTHWQVWFDGFRTLKFVHAVRDTGFPDMDFRSSLAMCPLWPENHGADPLLLREVLLQHWGWQTD